ncbi:Rhodanese-like domain-containing protein [Thelonectria olida]|uniref:protein-tyrosine-phosphatase n=1 Tax=Thelonectria olida TaxID=1576542 RepID=A0A9P8VST8_9HYPO|nr:Rhodanese-like domain-containing protein [Thelonectria olida]
MVSVSDDWMLYCALPPSNVVQSSYQACVAQMGDESQSKTIGLIPDRAGSGNPILPHFIKPGEAIPRITKETLAGVLRGSDSALLGQVHIIDCRFRYEYDGGHIDQALNYDDHAQLVDRLFKSPGSGAVLSETTTEAFTDSYPDLTYESVYVLDGGYRDFFASYPSLCSPRGYVEMTDGQNWTAYQRLELDRLKLDRLKDKKKRSRLVWPVDGDTVPPLRLRSEQRDKRPRWS